MLANDQIKIDGKLVNPVYIRFYQDLVDIELHKVSVSRAFNPNFNFGFKTYAISQNETSLGYFKILSAKPLANEETIQFTLHKQ